MAKASLSNQKKIIRRLSEMAAIQKRMLGNQKAILANQKKVLANQARILAK